MSDNGRRSDLKVCFLCRADLPSAKEVWIVKHAPADDAKLAELANEAICEECAGEARTAGCYVFNLQKRREENRQRARTTLADLLDAKSKEQLRLVG